MGPGEDFTASAPRWKGGRRGLAADRRVRCGHLAVRAGGEVQRRPVHTRQLTAPASTRVLVSICKSLERVGSGIFPLWSK